MKQNVVTPKVGESITEVRILKWNKGNGEAVKAGDVLLEIETDKATVEVAAESAGALQILKGEGETVPVGEIVGVVDTDASGVGASAPSAASAPVGAAPSPSNAGSSGPAARKLAEENNVSLASVTGTGKDGRVTKGDVLGHVAGAANVAAPGSMAAPSSQGAGHSAAPAASRQAATAAPSMKDGPGDRRVPMTRLRLRIAERLVQAQHTAAILTTFNEVDMTAVNKVRAQHKDAFKAKNGVNLSFMSFFTRACTLALKQLPAVNAFIDGSDVVYHDYCDVGIAVGTPRGLVVPVLRGADKMSFLDIEKGIGAFAVKARDGKLSIADMEGGTFTISNGGTYGSLMSTPILNPPQSAILGMHKIQDRPVVVDGKIEIRPMMYLALSYDHRIIDGKEAVTFLVTLRDLLENPEKLGLDFA